MNHLGTIRLETDRLILRQFKEEDYLDMYNNWASDGEVTRYLTWFAHSCEGLTRTVISIWIKNYENKESYQWAIELKDSGNVIGNISLLNIDNHNENCEIGYCIGRQFWNKGIITEAFSKIIDFAFKEVGFQRITGRHDIDNPASGRAMEKCGLKFEGTLRSINRNNKGILVDCKYYSILKEEYLQD